MDDQKIYINAFISACISIFIPLFVWGNIIAFLPWLANELNLLDSSLGFLFMTFALMQIIVSQISGKSNNTKVRIKKNASTRNVSFCYMPICIWISL